MAEETAKAEQEEQTPWSYALELYTSHSTGLTGKVLQVLAAREVRKAAVAARFLGSVRSEAEGGSSPVL